MSYPPPYGDSSQGDQPPSQGYPPYNPPPNYPPPGQGYYAPPPGQPGYPMQPPPIGVYVVPQDQGNGPAVASLILGILGIFFGLLTGIPAIITGHIALSRINANPGSSGSRGMAVAGLIMGYIFTALSLCGIIALVVAAANGGFSTTTP
jgi:hypothetical protein